jgi:hypothetical protein
VKDQVGRISTVLGRVIKCMQIFGLIRDCLQDSSLDGRIIIKWILKQWDRRVLTGFISVGSGTKGQD